MVYCLSFLLLSIYCCTINYFRFIDDNPMSTVQDPLEKGLEKLRNGDLPSAVLFFEAEVQQRPDSIQGWQYLGTSQAHNEQDVSAVAALEK